jgi:hypothetical protein
VPATNQQLFINYSPNQIALIELHNAGTSFNLAAMVAAASTTYYYTFYRSMALGKAGLKVYSDAARETLVGDLLIDLVNVEAYRYLLAVQSWNAVEAATVSVTVENINFETGELQMLETPTRRIRGGNLQLLPSVARTADANSEYVRGVAGAQVIIDVTAITATPSVTPSIVGFDPVSGKEYTILAGAAITGTGTTVLTVFPGATAAANSAANNYLPDQWRVKMAHADGDSITYSVSVNTLD